MQETQVQSLGWEDPLEEGMATHSSMLAWRTHGQRILAGCSPQGCTESDTTKMIKKQQQRANQTKPNQTKPNQKHVKIFLFHIYFLYPPAFFRIPFSFLLNGIDFQSSFTVVCNLQIISVFFVCQKIFILCSPLLYKISN